MLWLNEPLKILVGILQYIWPTGMNVHWCLIKAIHRKRQVDVVDALKANKN